MITADTIVVGGGPAGAACAGTLQKRGRNVLVLDRHPFPRQKICAGWITPEVFDVLGITPEEYPFLLHRFDRLHFHLFGIRIPVRTRQYAIRRYEFDHWLLSRIKVPLHVHAVKQIIRTDDSYVIDKKYRCRYLVGAGGTHCPVYRTFFSPARKRPAKAMITAIEKEYQCRANIDQCHLWYFENRLPGYAWYVPKGDGWINIGIGGKQFRLEKRGMSIMDHWRWFTKKLLKRSFIETLPENPKGHTYCLFHGGGPDRSGNAFIVGDAAGLATLDMGEGICAAIKSGIRAAKVITGQDDVRGSAPSRFSLPGIVFRR